MAEARILIIDDDDAVRRVLRRVLEQAGYQVADAPGGREGLRLIEQQRIDLVLCDMLMPEMDGIETIQNLRRLYPAIPIIAMSGGGAVDPSLYLNLALKMRVRKTLYKPIDAESLLGTVQDTLGG